MPPFARLNSATSAGREWSVKACRFRAAFCLVSAMPFQDPIDQTAGF
jgi:hypothetical protein